MYLFSHLLNSINHFFLYFSILYLILCSQCYVSVRPFLLFFTFRTFHGSSIKSNVLFDYFSLIFLFIYLKISIYTYIHDLGQWLHFVSTIDFCSVSIRHCNLSWLDVCFIVFDQIANWESVQWFSWMALQMRTYGYEP